MNTHNWQDLFDHHAPHYMEEPFVTGTQAEVNFLIEHLHLAAGMRVLDVGCGTGRHALELARRGCQVTGIDISSGMLAEAQKAAASAGVVVEWVHTPAHSYRSAQPFDAVYSVCEGALSLLGMHDPFDRDMQVFVAMFAVLKPGGRGLVTVLNGINFARIYSDADVAAGRFDPLTMTEYGTMDVETSEGVRAFPTRQRGYVPTELRMMLQHAGYVVEHMGTGTAGKWRIGGAPPIMDEIELLAVFHRPPVQ